MSLGLTFLSRPPPPSLSGVDYSLEIHSFLAHGCANMFPVKASYFIYK